ncbi:MAG: type III pantothenate kinase [Bacteroidetes bacterium]|nr:type III pantothenate kinase [Bacteroidota bacterium]
MNLTMDIGNTATKVMIFDKDKIKWNRTYKKFSLKELKQIFLKFPVSSSILSTVVIPDKKIKGFLESRSFFVELNSNTKLPIRNLYKTPETLGSDRLASVVGAAALFPSKNILVIDAGTCVKYDFITAEKKYLGGSISPGMEMRLQSLHNFTGRLPFIEPSPVKKFTGASTKESILSGVMFGIIHEMNGFIQWYKKKYAPLKVVISGGDAGRFAGHIKSSIFAAPNIIHTGLNEILKLNADQKK